MTTDTLNFPVFHSDQGVGSDTVQFTSETKVADLTKAKDFELAQNASNGDMASFEELYRRHHRRVYSICLRISRSERSVTTTPL